VDCRLDCLPYTELWPELAVQCPHSFNVCVTTEYDRVRCVSKKQSISSTFKVSVYIFIGKSLYIVCLNWINVCMWITPAARGFPGRNCSRSVDPLLSRRCRTATANVGRNDLTYGFPSPVHCFPDDLHLRHPCPRCLVALRTIGS
jgi:hypothetical protein